MKYFRSFEGFAAAHPIPWNEIESSAQQQQRKLCILCDEKENEEFLRSLLISKALESLCSFGWLKSRQRYFMCEAKCHVTKPVLNERVRQLRSTRNTSESLKKQCLIFIERFAFIYYSWT